MRRSLTLLAACLPWLASPVGAYEKATVSFHCLSVVFDPVITNINGTYYNMQFGVLESSAVPPSGELRPAFEDSVGGFKALRGYYRLDASFLNKTATDDFAINLPRLVDLNGNGIADFFEVSQAVDGAGNGAIFEVPNATGHADAYWTRPANSRRGLVQVHLQSTSAVVPLDVTFLISFQIFQYTGTFSYVPGNPLVTGKVRLAGTLQDSLALVGPMNLHKNDPDLLDFRPTTWTDAQGKSIPVQGYISDTNQTPLIQRTGKYYEGLMAFDEGSLQRGPYPVMDLFGNLQPVVWDMSIQDNNDANGNGIPDLSDPVLPPPAPPMAPTLALRRSLGQLIFAISGEDGRTYQIEQSLGLNPAVWTPTISITLSNDNQSMTWSPPASNPAFWRARVQ